MKKIKLSEEANDYSVFTDAEENMKKITVKTILCAHIIFLVLNITLSSKLFATAQEADILIYKGNTISIFANPLEELENIEYLREKMFGDKKGCMSTSCWRGYIAKWEIIDNQLYLIGIYDCCYMFEGQESGYIFGGETNLQANLKDLFGKKCIDGKVNADWFTGTVISPQGEMLYYVQDGYMSSYERELELNFNEGKLTATKIYNNPKPKSSIYSQDNEKLKEYIYKNIKWDILPLQDKEIRVSLGFYANKEGKIDNVTVIRGYNEIFHNEAIRVVKSIPEWEVYFLRGKVVRVYWGLTIIFSKENRLKYK